jgi:hypothetical protein
VHVCNILLSCEGFASSLADGLQSSPHSTGSQLVVIAQGLLLGKVSIPDS